MHKLKQAVHSVVMAGLVPAIYELPPTPLLFPWMPGTRACPRAARSADPWAGHDDKGEPVRLNRAEVEMKQTSKSSKTIRANKRKAKLKAKHRRQRARAGA
jgi:hypothetical protein